MYDVKCYELAKAFLSDEEWANEGDIDNLAQQIQDTIEYYIHFPPKMSVAERKANEMPIYKIQRPLDDPEGDWLAYREGHKDLRVIAVADISAKALEAMGPDHKGYFECQVTDNKLIMVARVDDQPW